jgi:predicted helicase
MQAGIREYLRNVERTLAPGNATEHSYRPALQALVQSFETGISATNEPKRVACGAPDFIVARQTVPIGYIECKDIGVSLDDAEASDQLARYRENFENLILTDYLEFRYYVAGQPEMHVVLARRDARGKPKMMQGADAQLISLLGAFLSAQTRTIATPKDLAARLANIAKLIRDTITKAFEVEPDTGTLHGELESFRATILKDITPQQFADMYAQTVCYGMFSARVNVPDREAAKFTREHAAYDLPATNPFLREAFDYIAGTRLDPSIVWAVDLLAELLRRCDIGAILQNFGKATRKEDPVVHFYETFLAAYDPALRESRGVYYTPEPVVGFIVRSVDSILKRDFGCPAGLADNTTISVEAAAPRAAGGKVRQQVHRVQILDPAAGTGTFLFETIRQIYDALKANRGTWGGAQGYVAQHLLPRLFGFELMMAPYAVAHLKLGWLLKETGYDFPTDERLRVYLTNTLEQAEVVAEPFLPFANQIAREANAASKVKTESPIMVVLGNPPYSGHSANQNQWSKDLIKKKLPGPEGAPGYFACDGKPLGERNPKWLNDDYVKFIRFGQYRIERTGYGILAFITNHAYLDNPTFRGMRRSLMETFDDIYILDLHGSVKRRETAPDGSKDENVFDIMQGVAICVLVKHQKGPKNKPTLVAHLDCFGVRQAKYDFLNDNTICTTKKQMLDPAAPFYLFVPQDVRLLKEYEAGLRITEVLPVNSVGIVTARDSLTIQDSPEAVWQTVRDFGGLPEEAAREKYGLGKDAEDWQIQLAQRDLRTSGPSRDKIVPLLYRPFDRRFTYYTGCSRGFICRPRPEVMRHMLAGDNVALAVGRQWQAIGSPTWDLAFAANRMTEFNLYRRGGNVLLPLYLYPLPGEMVPASAWPPGKGGRRPNLSRDCVVGFSEELALKFVPDGAGDLKKTFGPEDIFDYAYAVFHSPAYRSRYAQFLKIDFPRLPLTSDRQLFTRLCALGAELAGLHLLEHVPAPAATYPQPGGNTVEKPHYKPPARKVPGRVYVNSSQYFDNVPPEVWEFHVGGYQVCEKWLKDRKGRCLSYDDIETYRKITEAIRQTIRLMAEIDAAIPSWPLG